jgi:hypothetical protein
MEVIMTFTLFWDAMPRTMKNWQAVPPKCWYQFTRCYRITFQKTNLPYKLLTWCTASSGPQSNKTKTSTPVSDLLPPNAKDPSPVAGSCEQCREEVNHLPLSGIRAPVVQPVARRCNRLSYPGQPFCGVSYEVRTSIMLTKIMFRSNHSAENNTYITHLRASGPREHRSINCHVSKSSPKCSDGTGRYVTQD